MLARLVSERGAPKYLRSDNGPAFIARALFRWITDQGIDTALIDPGKPWQKGVGERFNGKSRDECLSLEWIRSRAEARVVIEAWRRHYNEVRPAFEPGLSHAGGLHRQKIAAFVHATSRDTAVPCEQVKRCQMAAGP